MEQGVWRLTDSDSKSYQSIMQSVSCGRDEIEPTLSTNISGLPSYPSMKERWHRSRLRDLNVPSLVPRNTGAYRNIGGISKLGVLDLIGILILNLVVPTSPYTSPPNGLPQLKDDRVSMNDRKRDSNIFGFQRYLIATKDST